LKFYLPYVVQRLLLTLFLRVLFTFLRAFVILCLLSPCVTNEYVCMYVCMVQHLPLDKQLGTGLCLQL